MLDIRAIDFKAWVATLAFVAVLGLAGNAEASTWYRAEASYYNPTGNRTSCGKAMTYSSWHVASLKRSEYRCGRAVRICRYRRCVNVRVQDRGAWRSGNRVWDLTPRVKRALRCPDMCNVRWHRGWSA